MEGGREGGAGAEGGTGVSSTFRIPGSEGAHGPNIRGFEGTVAIGTSDQSGYWEPKRIIRYREIIYLSAHGNVAELHLENPEQNVIKQHNFSVKQGLLQQFF